MEVTLESSTGEALSQSIRSVSTPVEVVNGGRFGVESHGHHCESALLVLVHSEWRLLLS